MKAATVRRIALVASVLILGGALGTWLLIRSGGSRNQRTRPLPGETTAATPQGAATASTAVLYGRILDAQTGDGISGATLRIDHAEGILEIRTDQAGRYEAVVDATRGLAVTIDARGYKGAAAFGRLCPGDEKSFTLSLPPAAAPAPLPPQAIPGDARCS